VAPFGVITGTAGGVQPFAEIATGMEDTVHPFVPETVTL